MSTRPRIIGLTALACLSVATAGALVMPCTYTVVCDRCVQRFWVDRDHDGVGVGEPVTLDPESCNDPGYATVDGDCDDRDDTVGSRAACNLGASGCAGVRDCTVEGEKAPCIVQTMCPQLGGLPGTWESTAHGGCDWTWPAQDVARPSITWDQALYKDDTYIGQINVPDPNGYWGFASETMVFLSFEQSGPCCPSGNHASVRLWCDDSMLVDDNYFADAQRTRIVCRADKIAIHKQSWGIKAVCIGGCRRTLRIESVRMRNVVRSCDRASWPKYLVSDLDWYRIYPP